MHDQLINVLLSQLLLLLLAQQVRTILSQNTTDITSQRAFSQLKAAFPTWEEVRTAQPGAYPTALPAAQSSFLESVHMFVAYCISHEVRCTGHNTVLRLHGQQRMVTLFS
jgi:hypothetical protein